MQNNITLARFWKKMTSRKQQPENEVERTLRVLGEASDTPGFVPSVKVKDLEEIISKQIDPSKKVTEITELARIAKADFKVEAANRIAAHHARQLEQVQLDLQAGPPRSNGMRAARVRPVHRGVYISSEDSASHPMLRSSGLVKIIIVVFALFLCTQPIFVALSSDAQTMTISLFVLTILLGGFAAHCFVETREQELRIFFGEPEDIGPEKREPKLVYSFAAFVGTVFVHLVYALAASRVAVNTYIIAVVTVISCILLFFSYALLCQFEKKYVIAD